MLGLIALAVLIPVEQREVDDPQEVVALALDLERVGHVGTHAAQDLVGLAAGPAANMTRSPGSTSQRRRSSSISSSEKNLTMGLLIEPSSRKAIQARPLAPNVEATPASLSILARAQAPAPLALTALTT